MTTIKCPRCQGRGYTPKQGVTTMIGGVLAHGLECPVCEGDGVLDIYDQADADDLTLLEILHKAKEGETK